MLKPFALLFLTFTTIISLETLTNTKVQAPSTTVHPTETAKPETPEAPAHVSPKELTNSCKSGEHWVWKSVSNLEGSCLQNSVEKCLVYEQIYGKCVTCAEGFVLNEEDSGIMSCSSSNTNNIVMAVLVILLFVVILMVVRSYKQNRAPADNYFEAGKVDADA